MWPNEDPIHLIGNVPGTVLHSVNLKNKDLKSCGTISILIGILNLCF